MKREWQAAQSECTCCSSAHDARPHGDPRCDLCAEALFVTTCDVLVRRWGGWFWLRQLLNEEAVQAARERYPDLPELEEAGDLSPWRPTDAHLEAWREIQRFGTTPWHASRLEDQGDDRPVGTLYLPVPVLPTDLKSDAQGRALRLFNELWERLGLAEPKDRGRTPARSREWDRYLDWLWQYRVEGRRLEAIENADSPRSPDALVDTRAILRGIDRAVTALNAL